MFKSTHFAAIGLSTVLAGGFINLGSARADTVCPPGAQCAPSGGMHKPGGSGNQGTPPASGNQSGQDQSGNMDWKKRHHNGNPGGEQSGQNQSGNMDWKHRRHHGYPNSGVGIGIYLGDGYDGGYYDGRRGFVSCSQASRVVRASGFRSVRAKSCAPGHYRFLATKRGVLFNIAVSGRGRIIAVNPAY